jgi:Spy/CpxP family protein refolding chaperone
MLQLTEDQIAQVAPLVANFNEQNAEVLDRARRFAEERESVWAGAERPKRQAMMELAEKYDYPMRELAPKCQEFRETIAAVLTPEQRAKLEPPRGRNARPRQRGSRG